MSYTLSIRERIEIQVATLISDIADVGTVYRYDARGLHTLENTDALIVARDETIQADILDGYTHKTLRIDVGVLVRQPEDEDVCSSYLHNHYVAEIEAAIMAGPYLIEPTTSARLAIDTKVVAITEPQSEEGQREVWCGVGFDVQFAHDLTSPNSYGDAIPALVVTSLPEWCTNKLA